MIKSEKIFCGESPLGNARKTESAFDETAFANTFAEELTGGSRKKFGRTKEEISDWIRSNVREKNLAQRISRHVIHENSNAKFRLKFLSSCGTSFGFGNGKASVMKTDTHAFYKGLNHCKSIWACPVCTPKIMHKRCLEIDKVLEKVYTSGMKAAMVTFTGWHNYDMSLSYLIKTFKKAVRKFNADRFGKKFFKKIIGVNWKIESFEVTVGQNGWHFHLHALWIIDDENFEKVGEHEDDLKKYWLHCYKSVGELPEDKEQAFLDRGFVVSRDKNGKVFECHSGKYICGWGADNELTGLSTKKCKNGNRTPFELLSNEMTEPDKKLWIEYCLATKGVRRVIFSRGLKSWAGIENKSDEILLEETELEENVNAKEVCWFDVEMWKKLLAADRKKTVLQDILDCAFWKGYDGVSDYCLENFGFIPHPSDEYRENLEDEMLGGAGCIFTG